VVPLLERLERHPEFVAQRRRRRQQPRGAVRCAASRRHPAVRLDAQRHPPAVADLAPRGQAGGQLGGRGGQVALGQRGQGAIEPQHRDREDAARGDGAQRAVEARPGRRHVAERQHHEAEVVVDRHERRAVAALARALAGGDRLLVVRPRRRQVAGGEGDVAAQDVDVAQVAGR